MSGDSGAEISIADIIIEVVPFSDPLIAWCKKHPNFMAGLKLTNAAYFQVVGAVLTSHPSNHPEHQVIGFLVYDPGVKKFKQDYILNKNFEDKEFILYTKLPGKGHQDTPEVKHINEFFTRYDASGGYRHNHHLTLEQIEEMAQAKNRPFLMEMARSALRRGDNGAAISSSQELLRSTLDAIRREKAKQKAT